MSQKKKRQEKENSERWLLTYSDLITLLVAFFIILYAMSSVDQTKYEQLSQSLSNSFGKKSSILNGSKGIIDRGTNVSPSGSGEGSGSTEDSTDNSSEYETEAITTESQMKELKSRVDSLLSQYNTKGDIISSVGNDGLIITFSNSAFFDSGKADLSSKMKNSLDQLSKLLKKVDNHILVEGNADNVPVKNSEFASNWQLSATRAANVVQYLVEKGRINGSRLSAIGYGEYHPIASNKTEEGRKRNRRIDITILYDKTSTSGK